MFSLPLDVSCNLKTAVLASWVKISFGGFMNDFLIKTRCAQNADIFSILNFAPYHSWYMYIVQRWGVGLHIRPCIPICAGTEMCITE